MEDIKERVGGKFVTKNGAIISINHFSENDRYPLLGTVYFTDISYYTPRRTEMPIGYGWDGLTSNRIDRGFDINNEWAKEIEYRSFELPEAKFNPDAYSGITKPENYIAEIESILRDKRSKYFEDMLIYLKNRLK